MTKTCPVTGKKSAVGGGYSNRVRATRFNPTGKTRKRINVQKKKVFVPETGKTMKIEVTVKGMRTLKKRGVGKTLRKASLI